jgi:hypothetical protein
MNTDFHVVLCRGTRLEAILSVCRLSRRVMRHEKHCFCEQTIRVTRLGEFSPIGWLLTLTCFFLNDRSSPHFGLLVPHSTSYILILSKNEFGYILGDFT